MKNNQCQFNINNNLEHKPKNTSIVHNSNNISISPKKNILNNKHANLLAKNIFKKLIESSSYDLEYSSIIENCNRQNSCYTDLEFPPNYLSLINGIEDKKFENNEFKLDKNTNNNLDVVITNQFKNTNFDYLKSPNHKITSEKNNIKMSESTEKDNNNNIKSDVNSVNKNESNSNQRMIFDEQLIKLNTHTRDLDDINNKENNNHSKNIKKKSMYKLNNNLALLNNINNNSLLYNQWKKILWLRIIDINDDANTNSKNYNYNNNNNNKHYKFNHNLSQNNIDNSHNKRLFPLIKKVNTSNLLNKESQSNSKYISDNESDDNNMSNIYSNNNSLIHDCDIRPGIIKNSIFVSTVLNLAENKERISKLFTNIELNNHGVYEIKLFVQGEWKSIIIDDYLPVDSNKHSLCFSLCRSKLKKQNNQHVYYYWLPLLEKAFAKEYGSYFNLESIKTEEVFSMLTGCSVYTIDNDCDNYWNEIRLAYENSFSIVASAGDTTGSMELLIEVGLMPYCNYTILEVHELEIEDNYIEKLIKIRNNLGNIVDWTGDWSHFSNHWNDYVKKKLNYSNKDIDNSFWMNYKDFKHYFSKVYICKVNDEYNYASVKLSQRDCSYNLIKFEIKDDNENSNLSQNNNSNKDNEERTTIINNNNENISNNSKETNKCESYNDKINNLNNSMLVQDVNISLFNSTNIYNQCYIKPISRFVLCKIKNNHYNSNEKMPLIYLEGQMGNSIHISKDYNLTIGNYLLYTEVEYNNTSKNEDITYCNYTINIRTNFKISLNVLNIFHFGNNIIDTIYKSAAKQNDNKYYFIQEGAPKCYKSSKVTPEGYAYIYFNNNEEDSTLLEDVKYTKFNGLKLLPPNSGSSYFVQVEPNTDKMILMKKIIVEDVSLYFSYHSNFLFGSEKLLKLTKSKGKKVCRIDPKLNIEIDIYVYTYKHKLGLCFYYENQTEDKKMQETIVIEGTGVEVYKCDLNENKSIVFDLNPGESKFIQIKAKKINWSVKSYISYKIQNM